MIGSIVYGLIGLSVSLIANMLLPALSKPRVDPAVIWFVRNLGRSSRRSSGRVPLIPLIRK